MWVRVLVALSISAHACTQQTSTRITKDGATFEWGWNQQPGETGTIGHYYVKLPQSEQQVKYAADESGYHGAVVVNTNVHSSKFALGERALKLHSQEVTPQTYQNIREQNSTRAPNEQLSTPQSVDIFLLQQQYPEQEQFQVLPTATPLQYSSLPYTYYTTPLYNIQTQHSITEDSKGSSEPLKQEEPNEQTSYSNSVVRVFKDHNCTEDHVDNLQTTKLEADTPKYEVRNINGNFGAKEDTERPLTYRGAVHFRVESPRNSDKSERFYFTTAPSPVTENSIENVDDGISRLVASTQDLISNDDLLRINHAAEKHANIHNDDLIKPRYYNANGNRFTVHGKIQNIVKSNVEHLENDASKERILQSNSNEYKFASPIIVQDGTDYKDQVANNIVSTIAPYLEDGFEVKSVRNDDNNQEKNSGRMVEISRLSIGPKHLAPITVALRLLNANYTDYNSLEDDHEGSDSEFIEKTVDGPNNDKTTVEVQESIPVSITHINDVEVHDYLEEGRSNNKGTLDSAADIYNKYIETLASSKKLQNNMNEFLYKMGLRKKTEGNENEQRSQEYDESKENLDSSENVRTEVEIDPDVSNSQRSELVHYYNGYGQRNEKVIQPIIIEKEVPVTQYVDRYIEKKVPYPQQIIKEVDRPIAIPVPYEKIVERPVEVTKYVDKPYPVEVLQPFPVHIRVPYPVEHKVFIDRPIHIPFPVEKLIEKQIIHQIPVPTPVAVPIEVPVEQKVLYPIPIETRVPVPVQNVIHKQVPVPYPVETKVPYPVAVETKIPIPYPVEKPVPVPVEKIVEKPITVTQFVEKPVHIQVPVPHPVPVEVRVPQPYPVEKIVEKKVPYPVPYDRIVEKKVNVPYPVEKIVEKIVEKPVVVTKYVDKPYPVEKRVPYPVDRIVEKKVPYRVEVPIEVRVPYPVEKIVEKEVPINVKYHYGKSERKHNYGQAFGHGEQSQNVPLFVKYYEKPNNQNIQEQKQQLQNQQNQYQQQKQQEINQYHQQAINQQAINQQVKNQQLQLQKENFAQQYRNMKYLPQLIQTQQWGNQYASSYQYINSTPSFEVQQFKKSPSLTNYLSYLTNNQSPYNYYGPPPIKNYDNIWEKNSERNPDPKLRRTDRTLVTNLRIEYGFKPPLIPSIEVDLDGIPINKTN